MNSKTDRLSIRYVGNKASKVDNVTNSNYFWPARGAVVEVQPHIAQPLLQHPDIWVVADSANDPMTGAPHEGLPPEPDGNVPQTDHERIVEAAELIESLEGQDTAVAYWDRTLEQDEQLDEVPVITPVTGTDAADTVFTAFNILISQDPDREDPNNFDQRNKKPKLAAVIEITGMDLSKGDVEGYWEQYQAELQEAQEEIDAGLEAQTA